mgnify:CR=1 FL=1
MSRLVLSGFRCWHLEAIDLEVAAGECVALSGDSGAGKTQLLRPIADLEPHQGQTYYFCCAHCLEKFRAAPERFLEAAPGRTAGDRS